MKMYSNSVTRQTLYRL